MIKSLIKNIGPDAYTEGYNVLILFGTECPDELKDACIIHEYQEKPLDHMLHVGGKIRLGNTEYTIEKIGDDEIVNKNLSALGHISLMFSPDYDILSGSVLLSPYRLPALNVGDMITFD